MRSEDIDKSIAKSLRKQISTALIVCLALVVGFGGVTAYAEISGAVIGSGKIIVQGRTKHVQHPDGGIIGEISVAEGDKVEAGQVLFRLDGTLALASLNIIDSQLDQLLAQEARLLAEQARSPDIEYPAQLTDDDTDRAILLMEGQRNLMSTRRLTIQGRKAQLDEQTSQYREQVTALEAQRDAIGENVTLLDDQIADFKILHERGLVIDSQMITIRRERASLIGSQASLTAEIAEAKQAITQTALQRVQVDEEFNEAVLTELDQKRTEIARLSEERIAALDRLNRLEIRSPLDGYLHQLAVTTVGGIVSAGETLVSVIPANDSLIVEAKLLPTDVDQVYHDQQARVRLSGLNQRITPELYASVIDISPDLLTDEQTGVSYYLARLSISDEEFARINRDELRPGMPVEVFVETSMRSILSYLVKPIADQLNRAMRES
ncbi:HlyD family type I secretion periplasmic adaptor subunit [Mesorhizobium sp. CAU 1741]|uniref:HlyD family type I secretion periplasmic adaptor subunit n=1 Tax=Mesorhizobium sp. CAU 1741 TaxID=3140366 RepID=UPI00325B3AE6